MDKTTRRFAVILLANFFFFLNFSALMLLPKYVVFLGYGPEEIGRIMGAFSLTVLIALPVVGMVAEKASRKALFLMGAALMGFATPLYALTTECGAAMLSLRVLQGLGFASAFGISGALVFDVAAESARLRLLGILTVANISTHALGPALGEYIIHHLGYAAFFFSGGILGCVALGIGLMLPGRSYPAADRLRPRREALPVMAASTALGLVFGGAVIFLPPYLVTLGMHDSSPFFIALVGGSLAVWGIFPRWIAGVRFRCAWTLMVILFVVLPLGSGAISGMVSLVLLALLFGAGYGYLYPRLNAHMIELYPTHRGLANTLFVWSFNVGMLAASFVMGPLFGFLSAGTVFGLSALAGILVLAPYGWRFRAN